MKRSGVLSNRQARLQADFLLLLVSVIWGSAFAAQRVAAFHLNAFVFNGLRFFIGAAVLLPLSRQTWQVFDRRTLAGSALAGLLLFGGTSFQQLGLKYTTAGNAGFITGLYVVLIPIFLAIGWGQKPRLFTLFASLLAALGLFLLSTGGRLPPPGSPPTALGDRLELIGAALFALHVIWIGQLVRQVPILPSGHRTVSSVGC
jgi:drug/metabolite transporter (DMT)-like permease